MLYSFIDKIIETKSVGTIKDCNDPPQCKVAIFNFLCYFNTLFSSFLFLFLFCICDTFQFKNRERYQPPLEISSCILYRFYQMKRIFFWLQNEKDYGFVLIYLFIYSITFNFNLFISFVLIDGVTARRNFACLLFLH